jgi:hypothetical protein
MRSCLRQVTTAEIRLRALCGRPPVSTANCSTPALRSNVGSCIAAWRTSQRPTHGHRQIRSRRSCLSASACHSIGGCFFGLIDILVGMDDDLSDQGPKRIPQVRYVVTARHGARRLVPHQAPARRVHGTPLLPPLQFSSLTEFGTVRSSKCPAVHACPPWYFVRQEMAMPVAVAPP